jgi:hypothetical protein
MNINTSIQFSHETARRHSQRYFWFFSMHVFSDNREMILEGRMNPSLPRGKSTFSLLFSLLPAIGFE